MANGSLFASAVTIHGGSGSIQRPAGAISLFAWLTPVNGCGAAMPAGSSRSHNEPSSPTSTTFSGAADRRVTAICAMFVPRGSEAPVCQPVAVAVTSNGSKVRVRNVFSTAASTTIRVLMVPPVVSATATAPRVPSGASSATHLGGPTNRGTSPQSQTCLSCDTAVTYGKIPQTATEGSRSGSSSTGRDCSAGDGGAVTGEGITIRVSPVVAGPITTSMPSRRTENATPSAGTSGLSDSSAASKLS